MKNFIKKNPRIIIKLVLSVILIIIGVTISLYPAYGMINPTLFVSVLFYALTFLLIISYFLGRKSGDYELLFLAFSSVTVGSFVYVMQDERASLVLGTSILFYTLISAVINGYYAYKYKTMKDNIWIVKYMTLFLIILMGTLTFLNLYREISVSSMMFAFYFVIYGMINLLEPIFLLLIKSGYLQKLLKESK